MAGSSESSYPLLSPAQWKGDESSSSCHRCGLGFSIFVLRRHHCRICGELFCALCSNATVQGHRCCLECKTNVNAERARRRILHRHAAEVDASSRTPELRASVASTSSVENIGSIEGVGSIASIDSDMSGVDAQGTRDNKLKVDPSTGLVYYGVKGMFAANETFVQFVAGLGDDSGAVQVPPARCVPSRYRPSSRAEIALQFENGSLTQERLEAHKKGLSKQEDGVTMSPILSITDTHATRALELGSEALLDTEGRRGLREQVYMLPVDDCIIGIPLNALHATGPVVGFWL